MMSESSPHSKRRLISREGLVKRYHKRALYEGQEGRIGPHPFEPGLPVFYGNGMEAHETSPMDEVNYLPFINGCQVRFGNWIYEVQVTGSSQRGYVNAKMLRELRPAFEAIDRERDKERLRARKEMKEVLRGKETAKVPERG
jgi:hypothetical protein